MVNFIHMGLRAVTSANRELQKGTCKLRNGKKRKETKRNGKKKTKRKQGEK